jgi:hypothetical protein
MSCFQEYKVPLNNETLIDVFYFYEITRKLYMTENLQIQDPEKQPLLPQNQSSFWDHTRKHKMKAVAAISVFNGVLFYAISAAGGENIERILKIEGHRANVSMHLVGIGSSVCYTMFFYKTLESLSLLPKNILEGALASLAPFAASPYLSAGIEGAKSFDFITPEIATIVGIILFILRMVNCVDGSTKLPNRLNEMKSSWEKAWIKKDYVELSRLIVTSLASFGYAVATTDAIYNSAEKILGFFKIGPSAGTEAFSYISSILGAAGILPMTFYWTHRGMKQLTGGGESDDNGTVADPTDRYTYASLPIVATVIIGTIGSATGTVGSVFGRLGIFASYVRLAASTIYATCGAVPGVSTLLRGIFNRTPTPEVTKPETETQHQPLRQNGL